MAKPWRRHLSSCDDLKTTYPAIRAGFVALALEKSRRATPLVAEARALKAAADRARCPADLMRMLDIQSALVTAAGVSDKAAGHFDEDGKGAAIQGLVRDFLEPAGEKFVEELVFRFLLVRGDTLGGSMRNVGGALAQRKIARSIISCLRLAGGPLSFLHSETNSWAALPDEDADVEVFLRGLSWRNAKGHRTLALNTKLPFGNNNVDLALLACDCAGFTRECRAHAASYIAVGELKGGIDPAGADEHWKTAVAALRRVRQAFRGSRKSPLLFFVGAAIEENMAREIWNMLLREELANGANLTEDRQVDSVARWLCAL
ncbi:MAG: restriction endonuclease [Planctomycetes bacterium]|nr:restriction endonuclease [Planctomycetota bacterium]